MGEQTPLFGLGKLYVCSAEDKEKEPQLLDEPIAIEPGMLTYKDDGSKSEYNVNVFSTTFTGTMQEPFPELKELLNRPAFVDVRIERKPGRMPRKMKKAYRSDYPRNTKWARKVANYLRRMSMTLRNTEIVVTREQQDRLSAMIEATIRPNGIKE